MKREPGVISLTATVSLPPVTARAAGHVFGDEGQLSLPPKSTNGAVPVVGGERVRLPIGTEIRGNSIAQDLVSRVAVQIRGAGYP